VHYLSFVHYYSTFDATLMPDATFHYYFIIFDVIMLSSFDTRRSARTSPFSFSLLTR